jgi:hypothetical protein
MEYLKMTKETIVKTANSFIGQEEITGNQGFKDNQFEELMEAVGWDEGQAWCAYFVELVWKLSYVQQPLIVKELDMIMSGSVLSTWTAFKKSSWVTDQIPEPGAIAIWQSYKNGKGTWRGHTGIVSDLIEGGFKGFHTIEGNTNDKGGREGYIVAKKKRRANFSATSGLVLKGFVHPR